MAGDRHVNQQVKAWDRVGRAMGAAGEAGDSMARRNLDLWNSVAARLREGRYTRDHFTADVLRALDTAVENVRDVWAALRTPAGVLADASVPVRLMFFQPVAPVPPEAGTDPATAEPWEAEPWQHAPTSNPDVPIPPSVRDGRPEVRVDVVGDDGATAATLQNAITPAYAPGRDYMTLLAKSVTTVKTGLYWGVVYVDPEGSPMAVANISIVVIPPPDSDAAEAQSK